MYEHRQIGWVPTGALVIILLGVALRDAAAPETRLAAAEIGLIAVVFALIRLVLTVRVDAQAVQAHFGIGWPRHSVPLSRVRTARAVRNRPWHRSFLGAVSFSSRYRHF